MDQTSRARFERLIDFFMRSGQIPDFLGELHIDRKAAMAIRACGFQARAGNRMWCCPLLPDELVWWNPSLKHLSDAEEHCYGPNWWNPKRAQPLPIRTPQPLPLLKCQMRVLGVLLRAPDRRLKKRSLQQRLWRMPANILNHILAGLAAHSLIDRNGPWVFARNDSVVG